MDYRKVAADLVAVRVKRADLQHNSDPNRLAALPAQTRERLTQKYWHAAAALDELAVV